MTKRFHTCHQCTGEDVLMPHRTDKKVSDIFAEIMDRWFGHQATPQAQAEMCFEAQVALERAGIKSRKCVKVDFGEEEHQILGRTVRFHVTKVKGGEQIFSFTAEPV